MTHHADALPPEDEFEVEKETAAEAAAEAAASSTASAIPPEGLSEEEQNAWWMQNVYCGDQMRQVTFRSLFVAVFIGALMSVSNLYVGLKTGWGLPVTITAAVIAYALFKSAEAISPRLRNNPLSMLENCTVLSFSSAAGMISSAGMVSAIPALYLCTGHGMTVGQMMAWLACVATLGCFMAIPLKRQLINVDKLAFPTGTATAETLRSLYSTGAKAMQQAKTLAACGLIGILIKLWADAWGDVAKWLGGKWEWCQSLGKFAPPSSYPLFPGETGQHLLSRYSLGLEPSLIMVAAGALMGIRVGISLLIGTVIFFGFFGPLMDWLGVITIDPGPKAFRGIVTWTLWPAVALMVTAGLTNFALRWRMIAHAMGELTAIFGKRQENGSSRASVEAPMSWFIIGGALAGAACMYLGMTFFGISWWMGILAVLLSFVLSVVAARATGETDTTPIGAMGKITQLTYGVIDPGNMTTNLMTAGITGGAACHSADLLQSLKTGYLVGANAKKQAIAQLLGIIVGVLVCVPIYAVLVRTPEFDPATPANPMTKKADKTNVAAAADTEQADDLSATNLLSPQFPAPAVSIWYSVAQVLNKGFKELPRWSVLGMTIGGILGILIALLEEFLPKRFRTWIPSATGLGLAGVITPQVSIAMFLGSLIAWVWAKKHPKSCDDYMISGASGLIAGESLTGVGINLAGAAPTIIPALWQSIRAFFGG
jgi:OPT family oligopeptide transporter